MDEPGQRFLAGSGLALDQHGRLGLRHALGQRQERLHARALGQDERPPAARRGHLLVLRQDAPDVGEAERLRQDLTRPFAQRLGRQLLASEAGDHHDDGVRDQALDRPQQIDAAHPGHAHVGEDQRIVHLAALGEGFLAVARGHHGRAALLDGAGERLAHHRFVIHHHDRNCHQHCFHCRLLALCDTSMLTSAGSSSDWAVHRRAAWGASAVPAEARALSLAAGVESARGARGAGRVAGENLPVGKRPDRPR